MTPHMPKRLFGEEEENLFGDENLELPDSRRSRATENLFGESEVKISSQNLFSDEENLFGDENMELPDSRRS